MMLTIQWWMWWKIIITRTSSNTNEWIVRKNRYGRRRCPNIFYICVHDVMWCDVNGITDEFLYSINNHLLLHDIGFLFRMIFFGNFNFVFIIWWKRNFFFSFGTFKKNMNEWQTCPWKKPTYIVCCWSKKKEEKSKYPKQKMMTDRPIGVWSGYKHKYVHTSIYFDVCVCGCMSVCLCSFCALLIVQFIFIIYYLLFNLWHICERNSGHFDFILIGFFCIDFFFLFFLLVADRKSFPHSPVVDVCCVVRSAICIWLLLI